MASHGQGHHGQFQQGQQGQQGQFQQGQQGQFQQGQQGQQGQQQMYGKEGMTGGQVQLTQMQSIKPNVGLHEQQFREAATVLTRMVSDLEIMLLKTQNYHWNVIGPRAYMLCNLFKDQSVKLFDNLNLAALQLRSMGHRVPIITECMKMASVSHMPSQQTSPEAMWPDSQNMIKTLLSDHETFINWLTQQRERAERADPVTEDFVLDILKSHRVLAHQLRNHMEREGTTMGH